jgi:hypothetical protein
LGWFIVLSEFVSTKIWKVHIRVSKRFVVNIRICYSLNVMSIICM